jgi:ankyrin repeat protein
VEVVRALVEGGADINKADNDGDAPLQIASRKEHPEIIRLLKLAARV